jgi:hypothetical protein
VELQISQRVPEMPDSGSKKNEHYDAQVCQSSIDRKAYNGDLRGKRIARGARRVFATNI